ncbi:MAG: ferrous iron transport protein B [Bacteroidales bacterium]|nr:ferrous iron transport protein B [Bacteroidales bacterium]
MTIKDLKKGEEAVIMETGGKGRLREHFLSMGLIPGALVTFVGRAPMGDPLEVRVQGYDLSLREAEAAKITVSPISREQPVAVSRFDFGYALSLHDHDSHPGLGEKLPYHKKTGEDSLPKDARISMALVGQQNTGKTTLFNRLTGSNQHVGNFPGVTVDRKEGVVLNNSNVTITDLPGIYSLSTFTEEETVSRDFILKEKPNAIINIVDVTNLERNLYLTVQLMELEVPMVLALNMMDELIGNGGSININELERIMGIPVVAISAAKGDGVRELIEHALHIAQYNEKPTRQDFCSPDDHGGAVHRCLHSIMLLIEDHALKEGIPLRYAADRLVAGDTAIANSLKLSKNELETVEHIILQMEEERKLDRYAAMAEMRYTFIHNVCEKTVTKSSDSKEARRTRKIDKVLVGKYTALPLFILVLAAIFYLTFDSLGLWLQNLLESSISGLSGTVDKLLLRWEVIDPVRSLVIDAVFGGVGTVVSFVPIIIVMFLFLSILEDSGYMARIAFISDKLLRKIGLSGRSIVPMLIGFGCTVPGVMACRTLPSSRDRKATILLTPFMSCTAKIAIYAFFASAFFPGHAALVMASLYILGIVVGILVAFVRKLVIKEEAAPFVMELPPYRMPHLKNVGHLVWDKTKDFLQRAFTVIFFATLIIWFFQSFDFRLTYVEDSSSSMLAVIAGWLAPIMKPVGLGDWRIVTSLISGFLAKESVVSTLEVLDTLSVMTAVTAIPMLIFCLLYTPCVAAIASIRRELGVKWAFTVVLFQCVIAWICALIGYLIAVAVIV